MDILSTRELAIAIWSIVGLFLILFSPSIRKALLPVLQIFFTKKIQISILSVALYTGLVTALFYVMHFWTVDLLKDTILWFIFVGIATLLKINDIKNSKSYYVESVKENLKWTVILEFITGLYTYNLLVEIIIVPLGVLIVGMLAVSKDSPNAEKVRKLLNWLLTLSGLFAVVYAVVKICTNFHDFATLFNLREFVLGPLLSLFFLPYVWLLSLYVNYEIALVNLEIRIKSKQEYRYARNRAILNFRLDRDGLARWIRRFNFENDGSKDHVTRSIREIKERQKIEKDPPIIDVNEGWSPFEASKFLDAYELNAGYYERFYENEWHASAHDLVIGNTWESNSITYYVSGTDKAAKRLDLILKIFSPKDAAEATKKFVRIAHTLYQRATRQTLPLTLEKALYQHKKTMTDSNGYKIITYKSPWMNNQNSFDFYLIIENANI